MPKFCSAPWRTVHITATGDVYSCLCPGWSTKGALGNLHQNTLSEIVNASDAQMFRQSIVDQSFKYCIKTQCPELYNLEQVDNFDFLPTLPTLPTTLAVAIDRNCNLQCASCRNEKYFNSEIDPRAQHILNILTKEYQDFEHPVTMGVDGSGDIFSSAAWMAFFRNTSLPKCFVFTIATNGNLITKNLDLLESIKPQLESVNVSLDAATVETYKQIRGGNFDIVLDGIRAMRSMGIKVNTSFVLQQRNYHEIADYHALAKSLDVSAIGMHVMDRWPHMSMQWYNNNQIVSNNSIDRQSMMQSLCALAQDPKSSLDGGALHLIEQYRLLNDPA